MNLHLRHSQGQGFMSCASQLKQCLHTCSLQNRGCATAAKDQASQLAKRLILERAIFMGLNSANWNTKYKIHRMETCHYQGFGFFWVVRKKAYDAKLPWKQFFTLTGHMTWYSVCGRRRRLRYFEVFEEIKKDHSDIRFETVEKSSCTPRPQGASRSNGKYYPWNTGKPSNRRRKHSSAKVV